METTRELGTSQGLELGVGVGGDITYWGRLPREG